MKRKVLIGLAVTAVLLMGAAVLGYQDWQVRTTPGSNPASGYLRMWADNATGKFKCLTSGGAACYFDTANTGTVTSIATTSPITGGTITTTGTIACATCTVTIANGTSAMGTSAIASAACASTVTTTATGVASTDAIAASFNSDPTSTTGYIPLTAGMLTIIAWPNTNNVNFKVCNNTGSSVTPGAVSINWRVVR